MKHLLFVALAFVAVNGHKHEFWIKMKEAKETCQAVEGFDAELCKELAEPEADVNDEKYATCIQVAICTWKHMGMMTEDGAFDGEKMKPKHQKSKEIEEGDGEKPKCCFEQVKDLVNEEAATEMISCMKERGHFGKKMVRNMFSQPPPPKEEEEA